MRPDEQIGQAIAIDIPRAADRPATPVTKGRAFDHHAQRAIEIR